MHFKSPTGKKEVRARPFASYAENGKVKIVRAAWLKDWFSEVEFFASGQEPHDDQVDSAALGFGALNFERKGLGWQDLYPAPEEEKRPTEATLQ